MADPSERLDVMFPKLTATQIARLLPLGRRRRVAAGEGSAAVQLVHKVLAE